MGEGWPSRDRKNSFSTKLQFWVSGTSGRDFPPVPMHSRKMKARRPQRLPGWEREVVNEVPISSTDTTPQRGPFLEERVIDTKVSLVPVLTYQPLSCSGETFLLVRACRNEAQTPS